MGDGGVGREAERRRERERERGSILVSGKYSSDLLKVSNAKDGGNKKKKEKKKKKET